MKQVKVRVSRVAGMAVLLAVITGVTPILSTVPLFGRGVMPAQAAEVTKWVLQDKDTKAPVASFNKDVPQADGSLVKYDVTTSGTTLYYHTQSIKAGKVTFDVTYNWTFGQPPRELTPGQTVELTIQGKASGNVSALGVPARYTYHADYVENFQDKSADEIANLRLNSTSRELSAVLHFTTPPIPPVGRGGQITLVAEVPTIQNVVGTPGQFVWIYRVPEETPSASTTLQDKLILTYYHPFESFSNSTVPEMGAARPNSNLVATLKEGTTEKAVEGKEIVFWVDPEKPGPKEPGKNLNEVLDIVPDLDYRNIKDAPPGRKYLPMSYKTDPRGEAKVDFFPWLDRKQFASRLLEQKRTLGESGKISGTFQAGVYNPKTQVLEGTASVEIEFTAMAMIVRVTGEGLKEYDGKARVSRILASPQIDSRPVEAGFLLMPGDIVDIDGNAGVEISWVTGERVLARVPPIVTFEDTEWTTPHARIIMLSTPFDSGFKTPGERFLAGFAFGFGVEKGIEAVVESIPYVGEALQVGRELIIELSNAIKDVSFNDKGITVKIRLRSKLLIDNTGDGVKIYTFEGSPTVNTVVGDEITLTNGKMVVVSDDGKLGSPQTFNVRDVEGEFFNNAGISDSSSPAKSNSSVLPYAMGAAALFVVALVISGILRRRRNG
ncbi:MAG: hypothetical protein Q7R50_03655 [Dehalococcoidales bacterium]|nr:hypothetical protein [Dehalococcoidales bacterium]